MSKQKPHTRLSKPRQSNGSILKFSHSASAALSQPPEAVIVFFYVKRIPVSLFTTASLVYSSFNESNRSTVLLARKVAMAIWSAEAYISDMFDVTGMAVIMTLIQHSPEWVVCMRPRMARLSVTTYQDKFKVQHGYWVTRVPVVGTRQARYPCLKTRWVRVTAVKYHGYPCHLWHLLYIWASYHLALLYPLYQLFIY